jgi:hypothetical protein
MIQTLSPIEFAEHNLSSRIIIVDPYLVAISRVDQDILVCLLKVGYSVPDSPKSLTSSRFHIGY